MNTNTGSNTNRTARLISGVVMLLCIGLLYGWSIFRDPLTAVFPEWTPTRISMTFTLSMIFYCVGGFVSGKLTASVAHRTILRLAIVLILAGFVLISVLLDPHDETTSLYILYVFYGVFCGFGAGLAYNAIVGSVMRWYPDMAGMASGMLMFGFGVGGMALGSVVNAFAKTIGIINTFTVIGAIMAVILFVLSIPTRIPSSDELTKIAAAAKEAVKSQAATPRPAREFSLTEMLKTSAFWVFFFWGITAATCGLLIFNSAANIATYFGAPALLGLITSVFYSIGCLWFGYSFDRLGRSNAMLMNVAILIIGGVCLTLGAVTGHAAFIFAGLSLVGFSFGGNPSMMSATTLRFFGPKHFAVNYATMTFSLLPAAIVGPLVSSRLQEISGGSYLPSFIMVVIIAAANLLTVILLNRISKKYEFE